MAEGHAEQRAADTLQDALQVAKQRFDSNGPTVMVQACAGATRHNLRLHRAKDGRLYVLFGRLGKARRYLDEMVAATIIRYKGGRLPLVIFKESW